jgi:hypothetical protein
VRSLPSCDFECFRSAGRPDPGVKKGNMARMTSGLSDYVDGEDFDVNPFGEMHKDRGLGVL